MTSTSPEVTTSTAGRSLSERQRARPSLSLSLSLSRCLCLSGCPPVSGVHMMTVQAGTLCVTDTLDNDQRPATPSVQLSGSAHRLPSVNPDDILDKTAV